MVAVRLWLDVGIETRETEERDKDINECGQRGTDIDTRRPWDGKEEGIENNHGWEEMKKKRHGGGRRKRRGNQKVLSVPLHDRANG